jgi:hypothetical protein
MALSRLAERSNGARDNGVLRTGKGVTSAWHDLRRLTFPHDFVENADNPDNPRRRLGM